MTPHPIPATAGRPRCLRRTARVLVLCGIYSYRALYEWAPLRWYIPTLIVGPIFQLIFFTYFGKFAGHEPETFYLVGNAVHAAALSCIFGPVITVGYERLAKTLSAVLVTPVSRVALLIGRAIPHAINGLLMSTIAFSVGWLVFRFPVVPATLPMFGLVLIVSVVSCTCFGMLVAALSIRLRDVYFGANLLHMLMLLLCGVNVPLTRLPDWLRPVADVLPLTHGIAAARSVLSDSRLAPVGDLLRAELLVGLAWAATAIAAFLLLERSGRRTGSFQHM